MTFWIKQGILLLCLVAAIAFIPSCVTINYCEVDLANDIAYPCITSINEDEVLYHHY